MHSVSLFSLSSFSSSFTSESREGTARVDGKRGEAQIVVVVVVDVVGADHDSLPSGRNCAHHFFGIGRCVEEVQSRCTRRGNLSAGLILHNAAPQCAARDLLGDGISTDH